ncbi:MAG: hypothetical protein UX28_C0003G0128 [Candidatus Pacebacteria bacterium GW2011_GWA1_46_10]|nr:MAG: hypothetical protein UX28_C0003G0128 [Candidatus Pacebacteria bacterium GW2011_GWA1_46_10]
MSFVKSFLFGLSICSLLTVFSISKVFAHPGNTASDGCHYCRTNCAKWGEVEGARHCHGGGVVETIPLPVVTSAPKPTLKPTSTPKPTSIPSSVPKRSSSTDITQQTNNSSDDDWLMRLLALGGVGYGGYQWFKNKK